MKGIMKILNNVVRFRNMNSAIFYIYDIGSMIDTHEVNEYLNSR